MIDENNSKKTYKFKDFRVKSTTCNTDCNLMPKNFKTELKSKHLSYCSTCLSHSK